MLLLNIIMKKMMVRVTQAGILMLNLVIFNINVVFYLWQDQLIQILLGVNFLYV